MDSVDRTPNIESPRWRLDKTPFQTPPPPDPHTCTMSLLPPSSDAFSSPERCLEAIQAWAKQQGYAVNLCRTKKDKGQASVRKYYYKCNMGGRYNNTTPNEAHQQCTRASRKTECPWSALCTLDRMSGLWAFEIRVDGTGVCLDQHNHAPSDVPTVHPAH